MNNEFTTALLNAFSYNADDMLMNPATGSVDTAENWALDCRSWDDDAKKCVAQFASLKKVY